MAASSPYPHATTSRGALTSTVQNLEADRVIGIVGAALVLVATGLSWYSQRMSVSVSGLVVNSSTSDSLWHVRDLAGWLIVGGAATGVVSLLVAPGKEWRAGMLAAVAGFGILVYSVVAAFDVPNLGSGAIVGAQAAAVVDTVVDVGPFVAMLGGVLLMIGGLAASDDTAPLAVVS
jgi:hypothetical protein